MATIFGVTRKHWPPVHGPPLRTGLRTTYGPVHGLPLRTPLRTTPQNRINIKNKDFTYCLSNRSPVSAKFMLRKCNRPIDRLVNGPVNRPGLSLGRKLYHCSLPSPFLWLYIKLKRPGFVLSFPPPFCSAHSLTGSRARPSLHSSSLLSRRGSHGWTVRTCEYESLFILLFFWAICFC